MCLCIALLVAISLQRRVLSSFPVRLQKFIFGRGFSGIFFSDLRNLDRLLRLVRAIWKVSRIFVFDQSANVQYRSLLPLLVSLFVFLFSLSFSFYFYFSLSPMRSRILGRFGSCSRALHAKRAFFVNFFVWTRGIILLFLLLSFSLSRFLPRRYIKSRMRTLAIRTRSVSSIVWILFARVCVHARSIVIANCDTRCAEFHCTRNNCLNAFSLATYNGEPTCSRIIIINNRSKKNTIIVKTRNSTLEIFAHVE